MLTMITIHVRREALWKLKKNESTMPRSQSQSLSYELGPCAEPEVHTHLACVSYYRVKRSSTVRACDLGRAFD